jgi:hypothetical protein
MTTSCPVTCPCRYPGKGAFLLAGCAFVALRSRELLGMDFGALVTEFVQSPHDLSLALAVWMVAAVIGIVLLMLGLRALLREGDSPAALPSLVMLAAATAALWRGWYPAWGAVWSLGVEGYYWAVIAGSAANLILALGAQVWVAGYVAAGGGYQRPRAVPFDPDKWRNLIERQAKDIARLTGACTQISDYARQLEAVLRFPPVKKAVLKALHPDAHAGAGELERRALTEQFQKASAVFDRLEQPDRELRT